MPIQQLQYSYRKGWATGFCAGFQLLSSILWAEDRSCDLCAPLCLGKLSHAEIQKKEKCPYQDRTVTEFTLFSSSLKLRWKVDEKENAMFGTEVIVVLMLIRILLPLGMLLWIGEWVRRRETRYWFR
jgi:hypothetical protein